MTEVSNRISVRDGYIGSNSVFRDNLPCHLNISTFGGLVMVHMVIAFIATLMQGDLIAITKVRNIDCNWTNSRNAFPFQVCR